MIKIKGKHNEAIVYSNIRQETSIEEIRELCDVEHYSDSKIRIMPDYHKGIDVSIGTSMTISDKISPSLVSSDISCGMRATKVDVKKENIDFKKLDTFIHNSIIAKMYEENSSKWIHLVSEIPFDDLKINVNRTHAKSALGTLGGGNHYCELNVSDDGSVYITVHTGSRNLGGQIAKHYETLAINNFKEKYEASHKLKVREIVDLYTKDNRKNEIQDAIKKLNADIPDVKNSFKYLEGQDMKNYLNDLEIADKFASLNRQAITEMICEHMGWNVINHFESVHNYIDQENMIVRKGATSAQKGENVIIPINMRDGSIIAVGKGNPDWNYSAPHGAGRLMSRGQARHNITLGEFKDSMKGIYTSCVDFDTIDESPMAYKSIDEILENIKDTVDVVEVIRPVYNYKVVEQDKPWEKKRK